MKLNIVTGWFRGTILFAIVNNQFIWKICIKVLLLQAFLKMFAIIGDVWVVWDDKTRVQQLHGICEGLQLLWIFDWACLHLLKIFGFGSFQLISEFNEIFRRFAVNIDEEIPQCTSKKRFFFSTIVGKSVSDSKSLSN